MIYVIVIAVFNCAETPTGSSEVRNLDPKYYASMIKVATVNEYAVHILNKVHVESMCSILRPVIRT